MSPAIPLHRALGKGLLAATAIVAVVLAAEPTRAQTLTTSLASAYDKNPELNAARSQLRSIDEGVAIARSGNRPQIFANFSATGRTTRTVNQRITGFGGRVIDRRSSTVNTNPLNIGVTLTQPLFQGFTVRNTIRQAEAAVRAQRSSLRNTEQSILLDAATAFMDVIQNQALVELRLSDIRFLEEQVRAAQDRFDVGEGTRTDVSQAEARLAEAQSFYNFAVSDLEASRARFRQVTGLEAKSLNNNITIERFLPKTLQAALQIGQAEHPAIEAAIHNVDVALFNAKALEGEFLPEVSVQGSANSTIFPNSNVTRQDSAEVSLNVSIPIYQGGRVSAQVRQAKEDLGTARIQVDNNRDAVRQAVAASWAVFKAAQASILAAQTGVFAAQLALEGVIEEQRVGQRTTLDVLNSQRDLVDAQLTLVQAERDATVAAYNLLSAVGRLSAERLSLRVARYEPKEHYEAVRDKWYGLRTPDGR